MAIIKNKFLVGILGNLIFKVVNGKQVVTTRKPKGTTKQSAKTIRSSKTYGLASQFGSEIMESYHNNLNKMQDGTMFRRLTPLLFNELNNGWNAEKEAFEFDNLDFKSLAGFEYNIKSRLTASTHIRTIVTFANGKLDVTVKKMSFMGAIKFPKVATSCELTVSVVLFRLQDGLKIRSAISQSQMIHQQLNVLEKENFTFAVPGLCLCLVSTFLHFYWYSHKHSFCINTSKFNPAAITAAVFIPESVTPLSDFSWVEMLKLD